MAVAKSCLQKLFTSGNHNKAIVKFQNNKLKLGLNYGACPPYCWKFKMTPLFTSINYNKFKLR